MGRTVGVKNRRRTFIPPPLPPNRIYTEAKNTPKSGKKIWEYNINIITSKTIFISLMSTSRAFILGMFSLFVFIYSCRAPSGGSESERDSDEKKFGSHPLCLWPLDQSIVFFMEREAELYGRVF